MKKERQTKTFALVCAAGSGTRFDKKQNKQFLELGGTPVLAVTLLKLSKSPLVDEIIVMARECDIVTISKLIQDFSVSKIKCILPGGKTRQESVYLGLKEVDDNSLVIIHDGARPFFSEESLEFLLKSAEKYGAAACGEVPKDTVLETDKNGFLVKALDRSFLRQVKTPQVFKSKLIKEAHEKAFKEGLSFTDDCSLFSHFGKRCQIIDGDYNNIKITVPEDIELAEILIKKEIF